MIDYKKISKPELIDRIKLLEKGSAYTFLGGIKVLPNPVDEEKRVAVLDSKGREKEYAKYVLAHQEGLERFRAMRDETEFYNGYLMYLEEVCEILKKLIEKSDAK